MMPHPNDVKIFRLLQACIIERRKMEEADAEVERRRRDGNSKPEAIREFNKACDEAMNKHFDLADELIDTDAGTLSGVCTKLALAVEFARPDDRALLNVLKAAMGDIERLAAN